MEQRSGEGPRVEIDEDRVPGTLSHDAVRERSELARHLRGSIFPADRTTIVQCALEEDAPPDMVEALRAIPLGQYLNVEGVWEALGGERELRTRDDVHVEEPRAVPPDDADVAEAASRAERRATAVEEFGFRFDFLHRVAGAPFLVSPKTTGVFLDRGRGTFVARYGPWRVATSLGNIAYATVTGPYHSVKTIGPARLSIADRGLTFATNDHQGVCIQFHEDVRGIDVLGVVRHPALTVTVDDVVGLRAALAR
jgi:hypothetical protein